MRLRAQVEAAGVRAALLVGRGDRAELAVPVLALAVAGGEFLACHWVRELLGSVE